MRTTLKAPPTSCYMVTMPPPFVQQGDGGGGGKFANIFMAPHNSPCAPEKINGHQTVKKCNQTNGLLRHNCVRSRRVHAPSRLSIRLQKWCICSGAKLQRTRCFSVANPIDPGTHAQAREGKTRGIVTEKTRAVSPPLCESNTKIPEFDGHITWYCFDKGVACVSRGRTQAVTIASSMQYLSSDSPISTSKVQQGVPHTTV